EVAVEMRRPDEDSRSARLSRDLLHGLLRRAHESGTQQQVLRRISRDRELREDHQIGAVRLRLGEAFEDQAAVSVEVADDRVDLRQREPHDFSLAVYDSESKT